MAFTQQEQWCRHTFTSVPVSAPAQSQPAGPAATHRTAVLSLVSCSAAGLPKHCAHPKKSASNKQNRPNQHVPVITGQRKVCSPSTVPAPCHSSACLQRWHQVGSLEHLFTAAKRVQFLQQSHHNRTMKAEVQGKETPRVANLKKTTEIKKSTVCESVLKEHRLSLHRGNIYCLSGSNRRFRTWWTRHVRDPSPAKVDLDLLCLHPPPRYLPGFLSSPSVSLALPSLWSQPIPLSLPYHRLLVLWTASSLHPRSLSLHQWLGQHQPAQPGQPVPQSSSTHAGRPGPPPLQDSAVCINKQITLQRQS